MRETALVEVDRAGRLDLGAKGADLGGAQGDSSADDGLRRQVDRPLGLLRRAFLARQLSSDSGAEARSQAARPTAEEAPGRVAARRCEAKGGHREVSGGVEGVESGVGAGSCGVSGGEVQGDLRQPSVGGGLDQLTSAVDELAPEHQHLAGAELAAARTTSGPARGSRRACRRRSRRKTASARVVASVPARRRRDFAAQSESRPTPGRQPRSPGSARAVAMPPWLR